MGWQRVGHDWVTFTSLHMLYGVCPGTYGPALREHKRFSVNKLHVRILRPHYAYCEAFPSFEVYHSLWCIINLNYKPPLIKLYCQPKLVTGHESTVRIIYIYMCVCVCVCARACVITPSNWSIKTDNSNLNLKCYYFIDFYYVILF